MRIEVGCPARKERGNMRRQIITISREFGSGGRTIGKEVAQRLRVP